MSEFPEISDRITALVNKFSDGNNSHFASLVGTSEANIRGYRLGRMPKYDFIKSLCENLEISYEWLISGIGQMMRSRQIGSLAMEPSTDYGDIRRIPIIDIEAAAGEGRLNDDYIEPLGHITIPSNSLHSRTATYYGIRSRGDSMFPTIYDKDLLIIRQLNRSEWAELRDEYVYIVVDRNGKTYVKRIKDRLSRGFIVLTSDNLDKVNYPSFTLEENELHYFFYAELKISAHFPNINATYFDRLKLLEDRVDDIDFRFKRLEK